MPTKVRYEYISLGRGGGSGPAENVIKTLFAADSTPDLTTSALLVNPTVSNRSFGDLYVRVIARGGDALFTRGADPVAAPNNSVLLLQNVPEVFLLEPGQKLSFRTEA